MNVLLPLLLLQNPALAEDRPFEVRSVEIRNPMVGLGGARFDLVLDVERTRGFNVRLRHLDFNVRVNGRKIATGEGDLDVPLRKGEVAEVVVPCNVGAEAALSAGLGALLDGRVDLVLKGEAGLRWCIFPFDVDFEMTESRH